MVAWSDLTVIELRQVLADGGIEYSTSAYRLKSQLVDLCISKFTVKQLQHALERFGKLPNASGTTMPRTKSTTPVRRTRSVKVESSDSEMDVVPSSRRRNTQAAATPNAVAAFNSIAASEAARLEFLSRKSVPNVTPTRARDEHSNNTSQPRRRKTVLREGRPTGSVVKAGRFSIPSENMSFSPTRMDSAERLMEAQYRRDNLKLQSSKEPIQLNYSKYIEETTNKGSKKIDDELLSTKSYWPAVDPEGNPVRWHIRDPFVFDVEPKMSSATEGEKQNKSADKKIKKNKLEEKKRGFFYNRCSHMRYLVLCVLLLTVFYCIKEGNVLHRCILKLYKSMKPKPYCRSSQPLNDSCRRCPDNALCENYQLSCRHPQFKKQWYSGQWICVKNKESYRRAHLLLNSISKFLSTLQGFYSCGYSLPKDSILLQQTKFSRDKRVGYTRCQLEKWLISYHKKGATSIDILADNSLVFDELMEESENKDRYGIQTTYLNTNELSSSNPYPLPCSNLQTTPPNQILVYYSTYETKSASCIVKQLLYKYCLKLIVLIILIGTLIKRYMIWKRQRDIVLAIKTIITDNTSIRRLGSSNKQGYALGPRAYDILQMMLRQSLNKSNSHSLRSTQHQMQNNDSISWSGKPVVTTNPTHTEKYIGGSAAIDTTPTSFKETSTQLQDSAIAIKAYPEFQRLASKLTECKVQQICDEIIKQDTSFCRSVLSADMIPFYFSKRVIDTLRQQQAGIVNSVVCNTPLRDSSATPHKILF